MLIQGVLKKVRYQKENGWGIFIVEYKTDNGYKYTDSFTGVLPKAIVGQTYSFEGDMLHDPKWGDQFKFRSCIPVEDETADGAFALLTSNRFKGVGPKKAQAIVKLFGNKTLKIIRDDPMRLTEVPGINKKSAMDIHDHMPNLGVWEKLRMMLRNSTDNAVNKIYETYGDKAIAVIKKDPYTLIKDVDGYGFLKADAIAASVGITGDHPLRVQAAIYHCLNSAAENDGHCFSYANNLQVLVEALIPGVSLESLADGIKALTDEKAKRMRVYVDEDGAIYLYHLWWAETTCAKTVKSLIKKTPKFVYTQAMIDNAANDIEFETGIELDPSQKDAVLNALNRQLCVITGGPGTGKTTIIRTIIKAIHENETPAGRHPSIMLMAPTGRASRRMREATGFDANTIHMSLNPVMDSKDALRTDYIIVDESSMIDISLAAKLLSHVDVRRTKVIFIGDIDQLPPVGPGVFFRDLIKSYKVPTVRLKFSFRQNGSIAKNANSINNGGGPHSYVQDENFALIPTDKEHGPVDAINAYMKYVDEFGIKDAILLSSTRNRGAGGTNELNRAIQEILHPNRKDSEVIKTYDFRIGLADRVMLTKNHVIDEHANGDIGTVVDIDSHGLTVQFDDDIVQRYLKADEVKQYLVLAYATTVHKSQGSEYKGVVFLFTTEHQFMGERGIVYTAVTRAKSKCAVVCDSRALAAAINKVKPIMRNSKLVDRINED